MAEKLKTHLYALKVDEWLKDPFLLKDRLNVAAHANEGERPRYTLLPAAAASVDGSVNITSHRIGLLHGGGSVHRHYGDGNKKGDTKKKKEGEEEKRWDDLETFTVPSVDVARWMGRHFHANDFIVLKADIEGAEFDVLNKLIDEELMCHVNVLFLECHEDFAAGASSHGSALGRKQKKVHQTCKDLRKRVRKQCPDLAFIDNSGIDKATSREIYKKFVLDVR
jgi:FkbM family methyltransferase